jgi:hypothetical protein
VGQDFSKHNADALERALAARRLELHGVDEDVRARREFALKAIEGYTALLREPAGQTRPNLNPNRYCFKLVFPDGRWSLDEKQLAAVPQEGDVIEIDGYGDWRIQGSQSVGVRPAGKAPREFFVCAPVAA